MKHTMPEELGKHDLLQLLQETKSATEAYFSLPESALALSYGEGKWNVRQILHHLADVEVLLNGRLRKIMAEPKQVIWSLDPDAWSHTFNYASEPLEGRLQEYSMFREINSRLIERYYEAFLDKEFVHSQMGLRTLKMEFEKVALHNLHHNGQIETALSRQ